MPGYSRASLRERMPAICMHGHMPKGRLCTRRAGPDHSGAAAHIPIVPPPPISASIIGMQVVRVTKQILAEF